MVVNTITSMPSQASTMGEASINRLTFCLNNECPLQTEIYNPLITDYG